MSETELNFRSLEIVGSLTVSLVVIGTQEYYTKNGMSVI